MTTPKIGTAMQVSTAFPLSAMQSNSPETMTMSRQPSPLPALSTSTSTSQSGTESSASSDPMYSNLPTYRFPAGPADFHADTRGKPMPERQQLLRFPIGAKLPEAPPPEPVYDTPLVNTQPSGFLSGPPMRSSTFPQAGNHHSSLKPALPILNYPDSQFPHYEPENVYPSGMVTEADGTYYAHQAPQNYTFGSLNTAQWRNGVRNDQAHDQALPQGPQVQQSNVYLSPTKFDIQYSPMSTPSTTYMPNSAYVPSSAAFAGLSPNLGQSARSAPSTPLGRQDPRFMQDRSWNPSGSTVPYSDYVAPHTEPRLRVGMPGTPDLYASQSGFSNLGIGYQSDDYDRDTSPTSTSMNYYPAGQGAHQSPYIPYARNGKFATSQTKRTPTFAMDLGSSLKKSKRAEPLYPAAPLLTYSSDTALADSRSKQQRCKIACSACRKTRLKCELSRV